MNYTQVRDALQKGELDEFLDEIITVAGLRRNLIRSTTAAEKIKGLKIGDTIIISQNCKPRMLAGIRVIYKGRRASKLQVELQQTYSTKWRQGNIIRIPDTLVGEVIHR